MQQVFSARTIVEVHVMRAVLEGEGIRVEVRGEALMAIQGEIFSRPSLWVADADAKQAIRVLDERQSDNGHGADLLEEMEAEEDAEGADAGDEERGQAAMSELFVVADRLWRDPYREDLLAELNHLTEVIAGSHRPFGIEEPTWARVAELATTLGASREAEDDQVFKDAAHALRDFLREYV